jgi:hypothetical protein
MRLFPLLLSFLLLLACNGEPVLDRVGEGDVPPGGGGPQYAVHLLTHAGLDTLGDTAMLAEHGDIIVGIYTLPHVPAAQRAKAVLYWDIWACAYYDSTGEGPLDTWQPGPGDWGDPRVVMNWTQGRGTHVYTWRGDGDGHPGQGPATHPDSHLLRFVAAVEASLLRYPEISRVFLDDWAFNRFWWEGDEAAKAAVWPGYPDETYLANQIRLAERMIRARLRLHRGEGWKMIGNGPACELSTTIQYHENAGSGSEGWSNLIQFSVLGGDTIPDDEFRYIWPGTSHMLMINAVLPGGGFSPRGLANLNKAIILALAGDADISIGVCYESNPRGSVYSCFVDPRTWPRYYPNPD